MLRTLTPFARATKPGTKTAGQGRPLGLLAAWLAGQWDADSHEEHIGYKPDLRSRETARTDLAAIEGSANFFGFGTTSQGWRTR